MSIFWVSKYDPEPDTYHKGKRLSQRDNLFYGYNLWGLPQERIAQRLGLTQRIVESHLHKSSELKNGVNSQLERGFSVNTIADKLDWREPLVWAKLAEAKWAGT